MNEPIPAQPRPRGVTGAVAIVLSVTAIVLACALVLLVMNRGEVRQLGRAGGQSAGERPTSICNDDLRPIELVIFDDSRGSRVVVPAVWADRMVDSQEGWAAQDGDCSFAILSDDGRAMEKSHAEVLAEIKEIPTAVVIEQHQDGQDSIFHYETSGKSGVTQHYKAILYRQGRVYVWDWASPRSLKWKYDDLAAWSYRSIADLRR